MTRAQFYSSVSRMPRRRRYPSFWREVLEVFGAAIAITALVCMAAGLVLGAHLIVEKVTQWL